MELISEELVEKTWKEAADINPQRANREIQKIGQNQPELLAFLMESTNDLSSEAQELTIYLFYVVYRMFNSSGKKIRRVTSEEITECYDKNQNLLKDLESQDAFFLNEITTFQVLSQPYVMKYVSEALIEEDEDFSGLREEENRLLFLLLKTVVDVLDKVT